MEAESQVPTVAHKLFQCCQLNHHGSRAVLVYHVRGFLFFWGMFPFTLKSPGWVLVITLTCESDPSGRWVWALTPHPELKCPREQRDKCATSSASGKVWIWISASLFTSIHLFSGSFLPVDCDMKMISRRILFFTYLFVYSSTSYSSEP